MESTVDNFSLYNNYENDINGHLLPLFQPSIQFQMIFSSFIVPLLFSASAAAPVEKKVRKPLVVPFKVGRTHTTHLNVSSFAERSESHEVSIPQRGSFYSADVQLGSNKQTVAVVLDTGLLDFWVPALSSCQSSSCDLGLFDQTSSSSYHALDEEFIVHYGVPGSQTFAQGTWAKEDVYWGDMAVKDVQFGLATAQDVGKGILGLSFKGTEGANTQYTNFPILLKEQGLVNKNAYSLYLNSADAASGNIIFGGIDTAKFKGDLRYFDIVNIDDSGNPTDTAVAFFVKFNGITQNGESLVSGSYNALLDSGTTLNYAPADIAHAFGSKYGSYNSKYDGYVTSCNTQGDDFSFEFDGLLINVPFSSLLWHLNDGSDSCLVSVLNSGSDFFILGDAFLRSAYVYYDLEDRKIGLAEVNYTDDSNIQVV